MLLFAVGILFSLYDTFFPVNQQNYVLPIAFAVPTFMLMLRKNKKMCNIVFVLFMAAAYLNVYLGN